MEEEQQSVPLDYARPAPPGQSDDVSGPVKVFHFIVGLVVGPVLLGMTIAFLSVLTDATFKEGGVGAIFAVVLYVALIAILAAKRGTRWLGIGAICGAAIVLSAIFVLCGGGFR